jgi:DNA-binding transcriptional MerR regulator
VENEKIPEKFYYRIGEIADHLKVNTSLLRFWEKEFERLIHPGRNKRGVRLYSRQEFDMFIRIHTLVKVEGMTLKGAREKLLSDKKAPRDREEVIHSLVKLKEFLMELKKQLK